MKYINFDDLKTDCINCTNCSLAQTRNNVVFGAGSVNADVLFIGEAPGENEDLQGEPFIGRGGKLLDEILLTVGLSRNTNIFIVNTVKCRPPKNRDPLPTEEKACEFWLLEQIRLLKPKIIVCVGRISAKKLIKKNIKIMSEHGIFFEKEDFLIMATPHPAAILRNIHNKPLMVEDFIKLKEKMIEIGCYL